MAQTEIEQWTKTTGEGEDFHDNSVLNITNLPASRNSHTKWDKYRRQYLYRVTLQLSGPEVMGHNCLEVLRMC